jgi:hypothetical protein
MSIFRSFRSVLLITLFVCGMSSSVIAESVAELESALTNCQDSWRKMYTRYQQECGQIDQVVRHANEVKAWLDRNSEPPLSLRRTHTKCADISQQCQELQRRANQVLETCMARGRSWEECLGTEEYRQLARPERECWSRYTPCRVEYDWEYGVWQASIQEQRGAYNSDVEKTRTCRQLEGQYRSVVASCLEIEKNLKTARGSQQQASGGRPEPLTYGGTLHTFKVNCDATEVKPGDIVSCTANGIYSSNLNKELDLTSDPATQWQNGPRVSTTNLRPGQTFRVTATRGGISDGVTITVTGAQGQSVSNDTSIDGRYAGTLGGGASGSIQFTVNGGSLSGNVAGTRDGDPFNATLTGTVDKATGGMHATLTGTVGGYAFNGTVSGQIRAAGAAGSWNAQNQHARSSGSWQAAK